MSQLGLQLPPSPAPVAAYVPAKKSGRLVYVSGQLPLKDGSLLMTGPLEDDSQIEQAATAMKQCFLNGLSAAATVVNPDSICSVVKLSAYTASAPGFTSQHLVANGASEIAREIFGEQGRHARAAVGVSALPLNASVELELIFEVSEESE